jgi:hypothetical protein
VVSRLNVAAEQSGLKTHQPLQTRQHETALGLTSALKLKLISTCPANLRGLRDRALIAAGYDTLCRRAELVQLQIDDLTVKIDGSGTTLVRKSKTDKFGDGGRDDNRQHIPYGHRLARVAAGTALSAANGLGQIKNAVSISERPASVEDRAVPGHWEGDLIGGARNSYVATLVERHSGYVLLVKVANKDTESVVSALIRQAQRLPGEFYLSLTWEESKCLPITSVWRWPPRSRSIFVTLGLRPTTLLPECLND